MARTDRFLPDARPVPFLLDLGRDAGALALSYFRQDLDGREKGCGGLVTEADLAVDRRIAARLDAASPAPVVSEEIGLEEAGQHRGGRWIVDPIDGTEAFAAGRPDFAVHVAWVDGDGPRAGMVALPAREEIWVALRGVGVWRASMEPEGPVEPCIPRDARRRIGFAGAGLPDGHETPVRLLGLDPVIVAEATGPALMTLLRGETRAVVRVGGARAWDLAAPELVVREAGGEVTGTDGRRRDYRAADETRKEPWVASLGPPHDDVARLTRVLAEAA